MSAVREPRDPAPPADRDEVANRIGATPAQLHDLDRFQRLLEDWNQQMNLVSPASLRDFWPRHVFDSAQLLGHAPNALRWADLGAGAGFPGLVLSILLKRAVGARVFLVESQAKRCRFLSAVVEALDLPAEVVNERAERLRLKVDVVTARAVAPLARLLGFAQPSLAQGGVGLFLKGRGAQTEIAEARRHWRFSLAQAPSLSDPDGRVLTIRDLRDVH